MSLKHVLSSIMADSMHSAEQVVCMVLPASHAGSS